MSKRDQTPKPPSSKRSPDVLGRPPRHLLAKPFEELSEEEQAEYKRWIKSFVGVLKEEGK